MDFRRVLTVALSAAVLAVIVGYVALAADSGTISAQEAETVTPRPTDSPTPTVTPTPTLEPVGRPRPETETPTPEPTETPTNTATSVPGDTATAVPTETNTPSDTGLATAAPTNTPPSVGTAEPTERPIAAPAATRTPLPIGDLTPTNTPFGFTAPTSTPTPPILTGPPVADLIVTAVEVTQGEQNLDNEMSLARHRRTYVRVYVKTVDGFAGDVKGALGAWKNGEQLGLTKFTDPEPLFAANGPISVSEDGGDRLNIDDSLYFLLPSYWTEGEITFKAFVYSGSPNSPEDNEPNADNNYFTATVRFRTVDTQHVLLVPVHLHDDYDGDEPEDVYFGWSEGPGFSEVRNDLYRLHPIALVNWTVLSEQLYPAGHGDGAEWDLSADNGDIFDVRTQLEVLNDLTDDWVPNLQYYGMIEPGQTLTLYPDGADPFNFGGMSNGLREAYGKMSADHWDTTVWQIAGGSTLGHELGHNQGLSHVNCAGDEEKGGAVDDGYPYPFPDCQLAEIDPEGYYGFDVYWNKWFYIDEPIAVSNDPGEAAPNTGFPLMGYVAPYWTDPYTQCLLLDEYGVPCDVDDLSITVPGRGTSFVSRAIPAVETAGLAPKLADVDSYVMVAGTINRATDAAGFDFVVVNDDLAPDAVERANERRLDGDAGAALFTLTLEDSSGGVLSEAAVVDSSTVHGQAAQTFGFYEILPFDEAAVALRLRRDGTLIAQRLRSENKPGVQVLSPNGGEIIDGPFEVTWTGFDLDGDELSYTVLYSADDGDTWRSLAIAQPGTSLMVESLDYLPGGSRSLFKVIVSDGLNSASDVSDAAFTVVNSAPTAIIEDPLDEATFELGTLVPFRASVYDWEDGALDGDRLIWESSQHGEFGRGVQVDSSRLGLGVHLVTLRVTDSEGAVTTEQVTITIVEASGDGPSDEERNAVQELLGQSSGSFPILTAVVAIAALAVLMGGLALLGLRRRSSPEVVVD